MYKIIYVPVAHVFYPMYLNGIYLNNSIMQTSLVFAQQVTYIRQTTSAHVTTYTLYSTWVTHLQVQATTGILHGYI